MIELKAVNVYELLHDKPMPRIGNIIFGVIAIAVFGCTLSMMIGAVRSGEGFLGFLNIFFLIPALLILLTIRKRDH